MRKFNLKFLFALCLLGTTLASNAQLHPLHFADPAQPPPTSPRDNWYKDYVGVQLTVTTPSQVAGPLVYTTANEQDGSGDWGGFISTSIMDKELVRSSPDTLACNPAPAALSMTGKVAFIWRGDCEFGRKAKNAEDAGAIAILIVNHSPGGPVGMGPGADGASVTIPVFMISLEQGTPLNDLLRNGATVKVSFTTWGSGKTNDLALLYNGIATWHAGAIPLSQIGTSGASPVPYKGYDGAYMANFGTANETNVKLKSVMTFTPTVGPAQTLRSDSISFASFPKADSIVAIGMTNTYDVHPPTAVTGKFDVNYTLSSASIDEFPGNNVASYSINVTDDVFCKGRYDVAKKLPISNSNVALAGGVDYTMGNLYYVANSGFGTISSIFTLSKGANTSLQGSIATAVVYKWKDSLQADGKMQVGELTLVATGSYTFQALDSSGGMYMINYAPASGLPGIAGMMLEANTWYWVAIVSPGDCFLGMDGITNQLPRTYLRSHSPNNPYKEYFSVHRGGTNVEIDADIINDPLSDFVMFPFEGLGQVNIDSARFAHQTGGFVPAITLRIGTTLGVDHVSTNTAEINLFPNPAHGVVNARVKLAETASTVTYNVMNIRGQSQVRITHNNVVDDEFSFSTREFAAGTYFLVINADNKSTSVKKFTVIK